MQPLAGELPASTENRVNKFSFHFSVCKKKSGTKIKANKRQLASRIGKHSHRKGIKNLKTNTFGNKSP